MCNLRRWVQESNEKNATFVVIGLDNAGKTTLVKALQGQIVRETRPTVGFQRGNQYKTGKFMLKLLDLGGGKKIRKIWDSYYADVHGLVYVIDSSDANRLPESKACLAELMEDKRLVGKPMLIFANKQDLPCALGAAEMAQHLGLADAGAYRIEACQALTDEGGKVDLRLQGGMEWLLASATKQWNQLSGRVAADKAERDEIERVKKEERAVRVAKMKAERKAKQEAEEATAAAVDAPGQEEPRLNVWSTNEAPACVGGAAGEGVAASTPEPEPEEAGSQSPPPPGKGVEMQMPMPGAIPGSASQYPASSLPPLRVKAFGHKPDGIQP